MASAPLNWLLKIGGDALHTTAQTLSAAVNELKSSIAGIVSSLAPVATSNNYNDLDNKPSIPAPVDISGKADKVANATSGNIAALDANGNLTDSGKSAAGLLTTVDLTSDVTGVLPVANGGTGNSSGYIRTGLASGVTAGDYATCEGKNTRAYAIASHAEGINSVASGKGSHAEGFYTDNPVADTSVFCGHRQACGMSWASAQVTTIDSFITALLHMYGSGTVKFHLWSVNGGIIYPEDATFIDVPFSDGVLESTSVQLHRSSPSGPTVYVGFAHNGNNESYVSISSPGASSISDQAYLDTIRIIGNPPSYAWSDGAHSEGCGAIALGKYSHAEGIGGCAVGENSHVGGYGAVAHRRNSFVHGNFQYNSLYAADKFHSTALDEKGFPCFGFDMSGAEFTADTEVADSQNGLSGTISNVSTVTVDLDKQGLYLLVCSGYTISSGALYGSTVNLITGAALSTGTPTNLAIKASTNSPVTIAAVANNKITIKNGAATRAVQFTLIRLL